MTLSLVGCGSSTPGSAGSDSDTTPSALTVEEVYAGLETALGQEGRIFHAPLDRRTAWEDGEREVAGTEMWADAARGVARLMRYPQDDVLIVAADQQWVDGERVPGAAACPGLGLVATVVLGCDPGADQTRTGVEEGTFSGDPAVVLVTDREREAGGGIERSILRTHLHANTFMPLGVIEEGVRIEGGDRRTFVAKSRYNGGYYAASIISDSLFDPAAKEIKPVPSEKPVDNAPIYWLGERFEAPGELPDLVLTGVLRPGAEPLPYTALLEYTEPGRPRPRGPSLLTIQQLTEIPRIGGGNKRCPATPIQVGASASAQFYCKPEGGVFVVAQFPDRALLIDAPGRVQDAAIVSSPYATRNALTTIIEELRSRATADDLLIR